MLDRYVILWDGIPIAIDQGIPYQSWSPSTVHWFASKEDALRYAIHFPQLTKIVRVSFVLHHNEELNIR